MGGVFIPSTPADVGVVDASASAKGIVELATAAEVLAGTDAGRVPSVDTLHDGLGRPFRRDVMQAGAIAETIPAHLASANHALASSRMHVSGIMLPACIVTNITLASGTTALTNGTGTPHLWFALYDSALALLGQSVDDTAATWAATSLKTKALASPVEVTEGLYYLACLVHTGTGGTVNNLWQAANIAAWADPKRCGYCNFGLTTTAPNPPSAITQTAGIFYGFVS